MPRRLSLAVVLLALAACSNAPYALFSSAEDLVIRSGTSFGMCIGYCSTELRIGPDEIVFTERSRDESRYPARTRRAPIDAQEWRELATLATPGAFAGLKETHGCPDCADGGAEWVGVERDGRLQRVVFEHGRTVPGIERLIEKVRAIRARFRN